MVQPKVMICGNTGYHNHDLDVAAERIKSAQAYKNLSTVIVTPTRGMIPALVVQSWMFLLGPPNAQIGRFFTQTEEKFEIGTVFCQGFEVGDAYEAGLTTILNDSNMGKVKYILTLEDDNIPPHDGLLQLYENICGCDVPCKEHFVVMGGLYWMKGEGGQPMVFGDPNHEPIFIAGEQFMDFSPQIPEKDAIQEVNGVGMGFTLFHSGLFQMEDELPRPWFVTKQEGHREDTVKAYTQDLFFMEKLRNLGYRIGVDTRVKVGHYDHETEMTW